MSLRLSVTCCAQLRLAALPTAAVISFDGLSIFTALSQYKYIQFTAESTVARAMDLPQLHTTELSVRQLTLFSSIITCLREYISWHQDHTAVGNAPWALPVPVAEFCADALAVRLDTIKDTWETLQDMLWRLEESDSLGEIFHWFGMGTCSPCS